MQDSSLNLLLQKLQSPILNELMNIISFFGSFYIILVVALFLYNKYGKQAMFTFIISILGSYLLVVSTKSIFQIPRPYVANIAVSKLSNEDLHPASYAFISGHSLISSAIPTFLFLLTKKKRWWFLEFLSLAVMVSRIYLGMHYYTDCLAGFILGIGSQFLYYYVVKGLKYHQSYFLISFLLGIGAFFYYSQREYQSATIFNLGLVTFLSFGLAFLTDTPPPYKRVSLIYLAIICYNLIIISQLLFQLPIKIGGDNYLYMIILSGAISFYIALIFALIHYIGGKNEKIISTTTKTNVA